jgi:hypothetical protein
MEEIFCRNWFTISTPDPEGSGSNVLVVYDIGLKMDFIWWSRLDMYVCMYVCTYVQYVLDNLCIEILIYQLIRAICFLS